MKKTTLFLAINMILISMVTSCKKDETTTTTTTTQKHDTLYYVQYDGKKYEVDKCHAFFDAAFPNPGMHLFSLKIASKNVFYDDVLNHFLGTGDGIVFNLITNSTTSFLGSNYIVDTASTEFILWNIYNGKVLINNSFGPYKGGTVLNIKSGSCSITQPSANDYLITGSFITIDGKAVKVNYKGAIPLHTAN